MNNEMNTKEMQLFFSNQSYATRMESAMEAQKQQDSLLQEQQGQNEAGNIMANSNVLPIVRVFKDNKNELFICTSCVGASRGAKFDDDKLQAQGTDLVLVDKLFCEDLPEMKLAKKELALELARQSKTMAVLLRKECNFPGFGQSGTSTGSAEYDVPSLAELLTLAYEREKLGMQNISSAPVSKLQPV